METKHPCLPDCNFATFVLSYAIATTSDDRAFLRKLKCHYVVLDEGHMLKNMQSQRYQGLMKVKVGVLCTFSVIIQLLCLACSTNDAGNRTISHYFYSEIMHVSWITVTTIGDFLPLLHVHTRQDFFLLLLLLIFTSFYIYVNLLHYVFFRHVGDFFWQGPHYRTTYWNWCLS